MVELQDSVGEVALQTDINEAFWIVVFSFHSPREKQFTPAADAPRPVNDAVALSLMVMIKLETAILLPRNKIAAVVIAGDRNPCLEIFRTS